MFCCHCHYGCGLNIISRALVIYIMLYRGQISTTVDRIAFRSFSLWLVHIWWLFWFDCQGVVLFFGVRRVNALDSWLHYFWFLVAFYRFCNYGNLLNGFRKILLFAFHTPWWFVAVVMSVEIFLATFISCFNYIPPNWL